MCEVGDGEELCRRNVPMKQKKNKRVKGSVTISRKTKKRGVKYTVPNTDSIRQRGRVRHIFDKLRASRWEEDGRRGDEALFLNLK